MNTILNCYHINTQQLSQLHTELQTQHTTTDINATHNSYDRNTQQPIWPLHKTVTTVTQNQNITAPQTIYHRNTQQNSHINTQ
jgi:hypothetical protein